MKVTEINALSEFMAIEGEWNALVSRVGGAVNERHEFFRALIESFVKGRLRILAARENGRLAALLPLVQERGALFGLPVRLLSGVANPHFTRFDMISDGESGCGEAFLDHLKKNAGWDSLRLDFIPQGGRAWSLHEAAAKIGFKALRRELLRSPFLSLPRTMPELHGRLSSRFRGNLRRRRRDLESLGKVSLERFEGGQGLQEALDKGFSLEGSGWKGKKGTAIASKKELLHFFTALAREGATRGYLALYFLTLDGRPIAFQYGLRHGGRYMLLKPGYDEAYGKFSPGQLLVEEVLRDCIAGGLEEFDFLGVDMPWKRDWTEDARPHGQVFVFPGSLYGRFLWGCMSKAAPLAKRLLGRA